MKKGIFEKARRRAIKLLGGYTDQIVMPQPVIKQYERVPVRIRGTAVESYDVSPIPQEIILHRMLGEIGDFILQHKLYTLKADEVPLGREYTMTVEILPPADGW